MIERILEWSLKNRFMVLVASLALVAGGLNAMANLPIDALGNASLAASIRDFLASPDDAVSFEIEHGRRELRGSLTRLARGGGAVLTLDDVTDLARAQE